MAQKEQINKLTDWLQICRTFIDAMDDQILVISDNHEVLMANKAFLDSAGLAEDDVVGYHCYEVSHHLSAPCQAPDDSCPLAEVLGSGEAATVTHIHYDSRGGSHYLNIVASPLKDYSGKTVGIIESLRDVTHQKRLDDELRLRNTDLEDAKRKREEFTSNVCHELKNIVNILGLSAQLLERGAESEQTRKQAGVIVDQSKRLRRLIDDMRDASAIETQRFSLKREPCDLTAIVKHAAEEQQLSTQKHVIVVNVPDSPIEGIWDCGRLRQVVDNLVSNAIKYSPSGGLVQVTVRTEDDQVIISVSDQGLGIAPEDLPRLFQPYARSNREIAGAGLGLFISRGIIEVHGGRLLVSSKKQEGSTFTIILPLCMDDNTSNQPCSAGEHLQPV